ncbi:MAG: polysaccharide biosynthesis tyrosine autokinase [Pyrinomonadaceae bacterium]
MENDQRLTPLPYSKDFQPVPIDYAAPYAPGYDDSLDSKRTIRQYANVVYKRLPIIMAITILVTAAAAIYMVRQPSVYRATSGMIIEPRKPAQTAAKESININFGDDQKYYNTQLKLLQNQDLMKRVVVSLGLHRDPNVFPEENRGIMGTVRGLFAGAPKATQSDNSLPIVSDNPSNDSRSAQVQLTPEEAARANTYSAILTSNLVVAQVPLTQIVEVSLLSTNPTIAPKVTDKVIELFIEEDRKRETAGAEQAYEDLKSSIEELRGTIAEQETGYITAMQNSGLPLQEKGNEVRASNLDGLLQAWREAQVETGRAQAQYNSAVSASNSGDIQVVVPDNKAIQDARTQNIKLQIDFDKRVEDVDKEIDKRNEDLKKELVTKADAHPNVLRLREQVAELQSQKQRIVDEGTNKIKTEGQARIKTAEREALTALRSQLSAAQTREARQRGAFEQAADQANFEGQAETKITSIKSELAQNRSLMDTYVQRQKQQELALSSERPDNIKVQNKAVTPTVPEGPQRTRNIMIALFLSLGAGIGLAFLLDYLDDSVRSSDDITRHLGLPTLALIPHYQLGEKRKLLPGANGNGDSPGSAIIQMGEGTTPMAEAYRHLRTSLLFSSAGKPPQTILVTSSQPSEGKTTTAINTAITLAQGDADVVIIDCDLRRPRLHSHFGLDNQRGLTNYLSGDKATEGLIRTYPDLPRLKIITSGPIPPNPAELLSSNEMRNLLQFLSGKFKHVIIDSPPAISFTDASILATLVDGVVLVAMAGKSSIHLMRQFKHRVGNIGARIYGVVLNGIKAGSTEYYYYGSGYYNYYSKPSDDESTPIMDDTRDR